MFSGQFWNVLGFCLAFIPNSLPVSYSNISIAGRLDPEQKETIKLDDECVLLPVIADL